MLGQKQTTGSAPETPEETFGVAPATYTEPARSQAEASRLVADYLERHGANRTGADAPY